MVHGRSVVARASAPRSANRLFTNTGDNQAVPTMTGIRSVAAILTHNKDVLDVAADVRPALHNSVGDDDRHVLRDGVGRGRTVAGSGRPRATAGAGLNDLQSVALETGDAWSDQAAHLVVHPPLCAPEVHFITDAVLLHVSDDEERAALHSEIMIAVARRDRRAHRRRSGDRADILVRTFHRLPACRTDHGCCKGWRRR